MASLDEIINLAGVAAVEAAEVNAETVRQFHIRDDAFDLSDKKFVKLFRVTKEMTYNLIEELADFINPPSRKSALDVPIQILTALRFFASGSYQLDIGQNVNTAISQSSVSRCIANVTDALSRPEIMNRYVKFPENLQELNKIRTDFYTEFGFPGVIGCIDCTHVAIYPPKIDDPVHPEMIYVNRKGYHSINVQLICDSHLKILNVNSRYPGSTNDSYIWNNSNVLPILEQLHRNRHTSYFLLVDSGYALRPWLLTPIIDAEPGTPEENYSTAQMRTKSIIERCNGVLKMRFRCLLKHRVLHYDPTRTSKIINSCIVLHNMCVDNNFPDVEESAEENNWDFGNHNQDNEVANGNEDDDLKRGRNMRQNIIRNYFT